MTSLPLHATSSNPEFAPLRRAPAPAYWNEVPPHPFVRGSAATPIVDAPMPAQPLTDVETRWLIAVGGGVMSAILGALCGAALSL
ncbi:hypothetical protein ACO2Q1_09860 [Brevundimonas sp. VNH65]|uniref:hypothetical protein n=1 Tax=Brevundimonas sp. VNH65 TaxID=3400917 RepID=UPI003C0222B2